MRACMREARGPPGAPQQRMLPAMAHDPQLDSLPESPIDWEDIPLGAGQEPNAYGRNGSFQYSKDLSDTRFESVRRDPDEEWKIISRVPERP